MKIKPINIFQLLSRVRTRNPVLEEVYSRVLGKPLLAESQSAIRDFVDAILHDEFDPRAFDIPGEVALLEGGIIDAVATSRGLIGVVDVSGPLASRAAFCGPLSYDLIQADFLAARDSDQITEIVMRFNTRGGESAGCFDLSDLIYNSRGAKPITAVIDPRAASAGYALASAADRIVLGRSSRVGSIGAYLLHVDRSVRDQKKGLRYEFISYGENKVSGNPHEPLSDEARDIFTTEINTLGQEFEELVARNLGMAVTEIRKLGANMFTGERAIAAGLAHEIGSLVDILGEEQMNDKVQSGNNEFPAKFATAVNNLAILALQKDAPVELKKLQSQLRDLVPESVELADDESEKKSAEVDTELAITAEELIALCSEAGHPELVSTLVKRDMSTEAVKALLTQIMEVEQTAKTLGLDGARIASLVSDPSAMIRMAISEYAEKADVSIDNHIVDNHAETVSQSWGDAFAVAQGKKRLRRLANA